MIVLSFPHNPTTTCVDLEWLTRLVDFAREHDVILVHDFAYSDTAFDGYMPPSILQVPGAKDVAVELYTLTKSFYIFFFRAEELQNTTSPITFLIMPATSAPSPPSATRPD